MALPILKRTLIILTLLFWALAATQPVHNPDLWYHLKTGEYISQTRSIPKRDFFSHPAQGREWITQWWLYDVIIYQIQSRVGFNGLVILKVAIGLGIALVLLRSLGRFGVPAPLKAVLMVVGMLIIANAWVDRPHLFSYLYTVILIDILLAYRQGQKRSLIFLTPLLFLWANTHASVPLALVLLAFAIFSRLYHNLEAGKSLAAALPLDLTLVSLAAGLASLLNPNQLKTHLYVFKINPEFVAGNIVEWIPLNAFFNDYHIRLFLVFGALSLLSFAVVAKNKRRIPPPLRSSAFELLIYLSLVYLALSALRFAPVFVLILLPFTGKNLFAVYGLYKERWPHFLPRPRVLTTLFALVFVLIAIPVFEFKLEGSGWGVSFAQLPVRASTFLLTKKPAPHLYHPFNWGGFLIWRTYPTYKVFIDGRLDMYVPDIYQDWLDVLRVKKRWGKILKRYDVNTVLVPNAAAWSKLGQALEAAPEWVLIYWDDQTAVFVRDIPANKALIDKFGLRAVLVFASGRPYREGMAAQAAREYRRLIKSCPECTSARNKLGVLYLLKEKRQLAKKYLRDAIRIDHSYASALYNYGYLLEEEGRYDEARKLYRVAIQASPHFPPPYARLGMILAKKLHFNQEALPLLETYLKLEPDSANRAQIESTVREIKRK
jgi:tetratricopeptide (TPR) repeat protein